MPFSSFVPDDSVSHWLTAALPLALAQYLVEAVAVPVSPAIIPVLPSFTEAAPVVKKTRKSTKASGKTKIPRKRSPKTATTAAQ
jgi:hypothetical protein